MGIQMLCRERKTSMRVKYKDREKDGLDPFVRVATIVDAVLESDDLLLRTSEQPKAKIREGEAVLRINLSIKSHSEATILVIFPSIDLAGKAVDDLFQTEKIDLTNYMVYEFIEHRPFVYVFRLRQNN